MRKFLMTTSRPFSLLLLLGLFLFACNKDKLLEAPSPTPTLKKDFGLSAADLEKMRQTLTGTNEKNFFDFGFAEKNNAKLLPASQGRDEQQLINAFAVEMINLNKTFHFVEKMTAKIGYPVWYRSLFFEDINTNDPILVLPFAHLTADSVSGFILASPRGPSPKWFSHIVTRRYIDSLIHINASVQNLDFEVAVLYRLDKELFGRETNRYKNWNNDDDNLVGFSVNDRCDDIYLIMTSIDCPPRVRPAPVNNELDFTKTEADDRGDCIRIVAYCSGSGNNPEPPSWTGDPTWTGSGVPPGTGGGYPSVITGPVSGTSAAFNQFWEDCQHTLNFEHGSDGHLITNSFQLSICNQIDALNNAGLTNIYTLDALYHNPLLLPVVHTFMTNHSGNSTAAEISTFVTAAGLQTLKVEDLELLLNHPEIYNLFKQEIFKVGSDVEKILEIVGVFKELVPFINNHSQSENDRNTAKVVALSYVGLRLSGNIEIQNLLNDIKSTSIGTPLWDMLMDQLSIIIKETLIDIIPGGTAITVGPQAIEQFKNGDWLGGMWTTLTIVLDEAARFIPPAKIVDLAVGLSEKALKLSKFYDVMKKVYTLGDDMAYKVYQVLRNKLDRFYSKIEWGGTNIGANVTGVGDPLDVWDDLIGSLPGGTFSGGNGNEIVYSVTIGGKQFKLKFYPNSTTPPNCPTISIEMTSGGNYSWKMRLC